VEVGEAEWKGKDSEEWGIVEVGEAEWKGKDMTGG
jgi:hypothetical protein